MLIFFSAHLTITHKFIAKKLDGNNRVNLESENLLSVRYSQLSAQQQDLLSNGGPVTARYPWLFSSNPRIDHQDSICSDSVNVKHPSFAEESTT